MIVVAIDIGGTFTDLIGFDDEQDRFIEAKSLTTPAQLTQRHHRLHPQERARCRRDRRADPRLDHRHQHADRAQGRQHRPHRHPRHARRLHHRPRQPAGSLQPVLPPAPAAGAAPPHPRGRRAAAGRRRGARSRCNAASIAEACQTLQAAEGVEAVAVCFLHSYANPEHERSAGAMVRAALPRRLCVALARDPARVPRVRAHLDHGGQRLYRPEGRRLCAAA